ncbi:MAG: A/G-specific adenine glycosylase [Spirochaetales bacterium]|nr:A/G-specific adenine glycosylase [Spirochaetales bacterium]
MNNFPRRFPDPPFGDYTGVDTLDEDEKLNFRELIYAHYGEYGRSFPWRETKDPYSILVSEIMLQQTQTERVVPKYTRFLSAWPDFAALSRASLSDVYAVWQGLGYNRRAKALIEIAGTVQDDFGGQLPDDENALRRLPMVGPATAAGVLAFAFEKPAVYLETNIRRVYIHFFFEGRDGVHDTEVFRIAAAAIDKDEPRQWHYALMDYGVFLKEALPGLGRRSRHYSVQPAFEGSNRQIRGAILRFLSSRPASAAEQLCEYLSFEKERVEQSLAALESEGMLVEESGRYSIRGGP